MAKENIKIKLLNAIKEERSPVGALHLSKKHDLPPASIGRILLKLESNGYLQKVSNKGREITDAGKDYLEQQNQIQSKMKTANNIIFSVESLSKSKLLEVLEVRKILECKTAELACINATKEEIDKLDTIMLKHLYEIKHQRLGNEQDLNFHLSIAKMSGNKTMYQVLKLLLTEGNVYTKFSSVATSITQIQAKQHYNIVQSIKDINPELTCNLMIEHLNKVISDVKKYFP